MSVADRDGIETAAYGDELLCANWNPTLAHLRPLSEARARERATPVQDERSARDFIARIYASGA